MRSSANSAGVISKISRKWKEQIVQQWLNDWSKTGVVSRVSSIQYSPDSTQRVLSQLQLVRGAAPGARVLLRGLQQLQHPDDVVLSST